MTDEARTTFEDPRRFLARHGLRPKDSFGQCFLARFARRGRLPTLA